MFDKFFPTSPFDGFLPETPATPASPVDSGLSAERSCMEETELKTILRCLELALAVYGLREGKLTAQEISLKSMLTVIRGQVVNQLVSRPAEIPLK